MKCIKVLNIKKKVLKVNKGKYVVQELRRHFFTTDGLHQKILVVQQRAEKSEIKRLVRNVKQQNRLALKNIFCATLSMLHKNQSISGIQYIYYTLVV